MSRERDSESADLELRQTEAAPPPEPTTKDPSTPPMSSSSGSARTLECSGCDCVFELRGRVPHGALCAVCDGDVGDAESWASAKKKAASGYLYGLPAPSDDVGQARTKPASPGASATPDAIGRYRVLAELGRGGMGIVYRAWEPALERVVALKVLPDSHVARTGDVDRFIREAKLVARLDHPNIVKVHEIGSAGGRVFFAMELVAGPSLGQVIKLRERPLPVREAIRLVTSIARALEHGHAANLVHRDVKPGNILVDVGGTARLTDYGLAVDTSADDRLTVTGQVFGTPAYMAPEQAKDAQRAGPAADIYALGAVLFELTTGELPHVGANQIEMLHRAASESARSLRDVDSSISRDLDLICSKALEREPERRYASAGEFADDLDRYVAGEAIYARPPSIGYRLRRFAARNRRAITALVGVAVLAAAFGFAALEWRDYRDRRAEKLREATAMAELHALESEIKGLRATDKATEASESFEAFVSLERVAGTVAQGRAWLGRAARLAAAGDSSGQQLALAQAYTFATDPRDQERALAGMAELFARRWQWRSFAIARGSLARRDAEALSSRAMRRMIQDEALARRDIDAALAVDSGRDLSMLNRLGRGTLIGYEKLRAARFDGERGYVIDNGELLELDATDGFSVSSRQPVAKAMAITDATSSGLVLLSPYRRTSRLLRAGTPDPIASWDSRALVVEEADTDGDGTAEIYVGVGPYERQLFQISGGTKRLATRPTARASSDIYGLAPHDFDGDGRDELVVGSGAWTDYDVKVLGRDPGAATLHQLARKRLGTIRYVRIINTKAGPRILAVKTQKYPSAEVFGTQSPHGASPGFYILEYRKPGVLVQVRHVPPAYSPTDRYDPVRLFVADLDGDGLSEVIEASGQDDRFYAIIWRQDVGGGFEPMAIGGLLLHGVVDTDGDGRGELVVRARRSVNNADGPLWVLGSGSQAIGVRHEPPSPVGTAPEGLTDDLVGAWRRATELQEMGLFAEPAEAFGRIAVMAREPSLASRARLRAAKLFEAAALPERGIAAFEAAARHAESQRAGLGGALRIALAQHDLERARQYAAKLALADPEGAPRWRWLEKLGDESTTALDFSRALDPRWRIASPAAVRRNPRDGVLAVDALAVEQEIATFGLRCTGQVMALDVKARLRRSEWAAGIRVMLRRRGSDTALMGIGARLTGGGRIYRHEFGCTHPHSQFTRTAARPATSVATPLDLRMSAVFVPEMSASGCRVSVESGAAETAEVEAKAVDPGEFDLVIAAGLVSGVDAPTLATLEIERIDILGCEPAAPDADPVADAYLELIEGRAAAALAALRGVEPSVAVLVARVIAASELADKRSASTAIRALAQRYRGGDVGARHALTLLLRSRRAQIVSLIRESFDRDFASLAKVVYRRVLLSHPDQPTLAAELVEALAVVDFSRARGGDQEVLLLGRGRAFWLRGSEGRARADLDRVVKDGAEPNLVATAHLALAQIDLADGDADGALAHAVAFIAINENGIDQIADLDNIDRVADHPGWKALLTRPSSR